MENLSFTTANNSEHIIFEGMTSISSIINSPNTNNRKIYTIYYDKDKEKKLYNKLSYLIHKSHEFDFSVIPVSSDFIDNLTIGSSHGGIIALCSDRMFPILSKECISKNGFYVMLEGIEDPYNFGYALRSLYAAGANGIILSKRNWMSAAGTVCRASAGASELLDMYIDEDGNSMDIFEDSGYKLVCAGIRNSVSFYEANLTKPIFLIIGGEKRGISSAKLSQAHQIIRIDYATDFKGSLSAASCAAIIGFEVMHQNKI